MPGFCFRSTWIVSSVSRQWSNVAIARSMRTTIAFQTLCPIQSPSFPRSFSSFATHTTRKTHVSHDSQNPGEYSSAPELEYGYTAAQVARAASQAVRVAIHEGNARDAHYVVNSILQCPLEPGVNPPRSSRRLLNPINFGRPVPSRLVVHSLVHGLMRTGQTMAAGREIQKMMAMGMRFCPKTIQANVWQLCSAPPKTLEDDLPVDDQHVQRHMVSEDSSTGRALEAQGRKLRTQTRLAFDILSTARQSRHQRSERMYGWLVDACLLQGEIVVATLLFVLLVKDWQLRKVLRSVPAETAGSTEDKPEESMSAALLRLDLPSQNFAKQFGLDDPLSTIPYPEKSILQSILESINRKVFSLDPPQLRSDCFKSLAIMADLVDQRRLPFGQLSPLIRTLYSCPHSGRRNLGYIEDGRYVKPNVHKHVHEVLLRLCQSLPSENPRPSPARPEMLPRLDTRTYNALIHYALRHRLSPALADTVVEHMTVHRKPPLQPDMVTYNTLLRATSLLRRNDLASKVLTMLRSRREHADDAIAAIESLEDPHCGTNPSSSPVSASEARGFTRMCRQVASEQVSIPDIQPLSLESRAYARMRTIRADAYTLSSYTTHLVSTGQPHIVAGLIFQLLPELHIIDHPAYDSPSAWETRRESWLVSRRESIQRAVAYGPVVFCAFLNALQKAGKTGLAERVWLLAQQAERASWIPSDRADAPAPWCLPIHAYTTMMQCYTAESKKGLTLIRGSRFSHQLSSSLLTFQERKAWVPQRSIYVKGWAYFFLKVQAKEQGFRDTEPPLRWKTSRAVGHLLLKSMRGGAISVWQDLMDLQRKHILQRSPHWASRLQSLEFPVGDARFFNAVLDMFGRRPNMQARRVRASPSWWRRKLRITQKQYGDSGWLSMAYDHTLVEIARGMVRAGYELPSGLRRVLVGRVAFRVRDDEPREDNIRPLMFPRAARARFRPFSVPVTKSRGLPLRKRQPVPWKRRRSGER